jgi:hypothetical protein
MQQWNTIKGNQSNRPEYKKRKLGYRPIAPIDELTLLSGNEILNVEKNTKIFLQVQKFIQDTGRFTIN